MSENLPILVLAGGKIAPEMQSVAGDIKNRALLALNGRPMLDYVLTALIEGRRDAGKTGRLMVAGKNLPLPADATPVPDGDSLVDTLLAGIALLENSETHLLVSTADIPFLTGAAVADLIDRASAYPDADFIYPIVDASLCRTAFPGMRRTTLRLAEGTYTGGNLAIVNPSFLRTKEGKLRQAYANRKSVSGLARMLGFETLCRLLLSRIAPAALPTAFLEQAVGKLLGGARAKAIITPFPEIGADVDRLEDIPIADRILRERAGLPPLP